MSTTISWVTTPGSIGSYPANVAMVFNISAVAEDATIVDYKIISGSLPNSLEMRPNGKIYGIPNTVPANITTTFTVRVTALSGTTEFSKDGTFTITITGTAIPQFITPEGSLPGSPVYDSTWYELPITYSNPISTNPVVIRVQSGSLPQGLEINEFGLIRGYIDPPIFTENYPLTTTTATTTISTNNTITVLSTNNIFTNRPIKFSQYLLNPLFGGLSSTTTYYVKEIIDSITITITDIPNGNVISLSNGSGLMNVTLPMVTNGQPTLFQYNFTLELISPFGNDTASYNMVVKNYYLPAAEGGPVTPNIPETRTPTILNTRPETFNIIESNNYGYYVLPPVNTVSVPGTTYDPNSDAYIGQFLSNNFFSFKVMSFDFDNFPITYNFNNSLPNWATGNTQTGWIYGDPNIAANSVQEFSFTAKATKVANLNAVYITDNAGNFTCTSISPYILSNSLPVNVSGTLTNTIIQNVEIIGIKGFFRFSGTSSNFFLTVNMPVTVTGTLTGTGSIPSYFSGITYFIVNTNAVTGFQLSNIINGTPIVTIPGTTTGLTFTVPAGTINGYIAPGPQIYYIKTTNGSNTFQLSSTVGGPAIQTTSGITSGLQFQVIYNNSSPTFNYSFRVSNNINGEIVWLTDSNLGTFYNTSISYQNITATSDVELNYVKVSGNLPPNLELLSNGEIIGTIAYQPSDNYQELNANSTYEFTVNAYANSNLAPIINSTKTFTMTVVQEIETVTDNLYIQCSPDLASRAKIYSLLSDSNLIPETYLYRPEDSNFGKATEVIYAHAYGIHSSNLNEYIAAVQKNHYWRDITLGEINTAVAKDENGKIIYEVVYSTIIDNLMKYDPNNNVDYRYAVSVSEEIFWSRFIVLNLGPWITSDTDLYTSYIFGTNAYLITNFTTYDILTQYDLTLRTNAGIYNFYTSLSPGYARLLYPNSLDNMRKRVEQDLGIDNNFRKLPLWMTSQQRDGNTLGFTPAWVICYTKPSPAIEIVVTQTLDFPDVMILQSIEGISVNGQIVFTGSTFGNILSNKVYYVVAVNVSQKSIVLSETKNGIPITLFAETGLMNGTFDLGSYAEIIKSNIENNWPYQLNQINFKIDRFTVDKQMTYDLNTYTNPKVWNQYPSASPEPNPEDSQNFYVLFPRPTILPTENQYNF